MISCLEIKAVVRRIKTAHIAAIAATLTSALAWGQFQGSAPSQMVPQSQPPVVQQAFPGDTSTLSLLPGDVFQIQVYDLPKFDFRARLDQKGDVSLPLIGDVNLAGLTLSQAEHRLERMLRDREMVLDPQVVLTIIESPNHVASVMGEVKTPGLIPIYGDRHLLDVLAAAGGLTAASSPVISVYRRNQNDPIQVHLSADASEEYASNIRILPGDTVVVPRVGVVYVVGAVHTQGAIPLKNTTPLTLIEALSMAGGVNYEAADKKAFLVRVTPSGKVEYAFDVGKVLKEQASDMVLQNDDIILIPTNAMKAALKGGAAGVAASLVAGIGYITVLR
jgi:polysaccharide export outer membrane protein